MDINSKKIRDEAKFQVFAHLSKALLVYILSGIISTVVMYNMQITALDKNITFNLETAPIIYFITLVGVIINMPLSFCAQRFYLILSRQTPFEPIPLKRFFEPFEKPAFLLKGTALLLVTSILDAFGIFVLYFPVYLAFFASAFVLADNPELSVFEAMKRSATLMKGRKMFAFKTLLPLFAIYILAAVFLASFYFISFFVTSVVQIMIFVTLAMIYDKSRQN